MTAVPQITLLLGLLAAVQGALRARDPEVEDEEDLGRGGGGGGGGWAHHQPPHLRSNVHHHQGPRGAEDLPPPRDMEADLGLEEDAGAPPTGGEGGSYPARTGNWCAFVSRRVVSVAVSCGTEKYTIKSQSPCPNGTPDCQLVMYKLSTRPVYREKQKVFYALLWRCCPGHGGTDCEETVPDGGSDSAETEGRLQPGNPDLHLADGQSILDHLPQGLDHLPQGLDHLPQGLDHLPQGLDLDVKPRDFQVSGGGSPYDTQSHEGHHDNDTHADPAGSSPYPGQEEYDPHHGNPRHGNQHPYHPHPHLQHHPDSHPQGEPAMGQVTVDMEPYQESLSPQLLPHMMALILDQLQPVLDGFNRSLEHLTQEVGGLARELGQLRREEREELRAGGGAEALEAKLEEAVQHMEEVRRQLESHHATMEDRFHSQQVTLHYNLTSFKTDMDVKLKRNHKMLQVTLQAMNTSLSDARLETEILSDDFQRHVASLGDTVRPALTHTPQPLHPQPPLPDSAVWEAIERLDKKVVNNTVKVSALTEDLEEVRGSVAELQQGLQTLGEDIAQSRRDTQILFMETGLEVEQAKVGTDNTVKELSLNVTALLKQLRELESDVDYLYPVYYKNVSTPGGECDCGDLKAAVASLREGLTNVTELAHDNRMALDAEAGADNWGAAGEVGGWGEDLHQGLQQVRESLAFEQERTRTLADNVSQLLSSAASVAGLREADVRLEEQMHTLDSKFASLLTDALRHTHVLEALLGEEVLEFMDWPQDDQEAHSIPALKEMIRHLQEQISGHNLSLASLLAAQTRSQDAPAADQPSPPVDWSDRGLRDQDREQQLFDYPDDLSSLKNAMEELGLQVKRLEQRPCPAKCNVSRETTPSNGVQAKLQAEVAWLRRGLEDHLRVFKNVFSHSEGLEGSENTLNLDRLWELQRNKEAKKQRRRARERDGERAAVRRSRRDTSEPQPQAGLLFLAEAFSGAKSQKLMPFETTYLNHDHTYSTAHGSFQAPVSGIYGFVLTLAFNPGPASVGLRRESGCWALRYEEEATESDPLTRVGLVPLRKGEKVYLKLLQGTLATDYPGENVFAGLLLHQTT